MASWTLARAWNIAAGYPLYCVGHFMLSAHAAGECAWEVTVPEHEECTSAFGLTRGPRMTTRCLTACVTTWIKRSSASWTRAPHGGSAPRVAARHHVPHGCELVAFRRTGEC